MTAFRKSRNAATPQKLRRYSPARGFSKVETAVHVVCKTGGEKRQSKVLGKTHKSWNRSSSWTAQWELG